jgi:hypothetical protein
MAMWDAHVEERLRRGEDGQLRRRQNANDRMVRPVAGTLESYAARGMIR